MLGLLERFNGERTRDGRKTLEEIFEGFATFQILKERMDGHSCPTEYGDAVHGFRVSRDCLGHDLIVTQFPVLWNGRQFRRSQAERGQIQTTHNRRDEYFASTTIRR
jgi:hypothetical protein